MLTKTESILRYIQQHPGCTNVMIAKDLALDATRVAALTGQMCKPTAGGVRVCDESRIRRNAHQATNLSMSSSRRVPLQPKKFRNGSIPVMLRVAPRRLLCRRLTG